VGVDGLDAADPSGSGTARGVLAKREPNAVGRRRPNIVALGMVSDYARSPLSLTMLGSVQSRGTL
jgi:hypothetical protein